MYVLLARALKTEYTKSSSLTNDCAPVLRTSTTNNLFYKLYRRRDSYGKICKAKNTASCAKSV